MERTTNALPPPLLMVKQGTFKTFKKFHFSSTQISVSAGSSINPVAENCPVQSISSRRIIERYNLSQQDDV